MDVTDGGKEQQAAGVGILLQIMMLVLSFVLGHILRRKRIYVLPEASASLLIGLLVGTLANISHTQTSIRSQFTFYFHSYSIISFSVSLEPHFLTFSPKQGVVQLSRGVFLPLPFTSHNIISSTTRILLLFLFAFFLYFITITYFFHFLDLALSLYSVWLQSLACKFFFSCHFTLVAFFRFKLVFSICVLCRNLFSLILELLSRLLYSAPFWLPL